MFNKRCARCGSSFTRLGCAPGQGGWIGRILGGLICFLLFGGTSKYCPSCREAMKEEGEEVDKGLLFRLIWLIVALGIIYLIVKAA